MPIARLLIRPADTQGHRLVIAAADDLQRDRQIGRRKAIGHCQGAKIEEVDKASEMSGSRRLVDRIERDGRRLGRWCQLRIDIAKRGRELPLRLLAIVECGEIISRRDAAARGDARPYRLVDR